jgi:adenosylcobinamide-GDP ribazoletransferase
MEYRLGSALRLLLAVRALTVLRVPLRESVTPDDLRASTAFYPLAGLFVGLCPAAALTLPLPAHLRAVAALAVWTVASAARPLEGWAAAADAALAPPRPTPELTRERRLAILRDPHRATFGVAAVVLLLLAKGAALASVPATVPLLAAPLARWTMVYALRAYPAARRDGPTAVLAGQVPFGAATLVATGVLVPLTAILPDPFRTAAAVVVGTLVALSTVDLLARRFGGVTGEVCGAACAAAEAAVLWTFAA